MTEFKQCFRCGRSGVRQFVRYIGGSGWVCRADKACERRRRAWDRRFQPRRISRREGRKQAA